MEDDKRGSGVEVADDLIPRLELVAVTSKRRPAFDGGCVLVDVPFIE